MMSQFYGHALYSHRVVAGMSVIGDCYLHYSGVQLSQYGSAAYCKFCCVDFAAQGCCTLLCCMSIEMANTYTDDYRYPLSLHPVIHLPGSHTIITVASTLMANTLNGFNLHDVQGDFPLSLHLVIHLPGGPE